MGLEGRNFCQNGLAEQCEKGRSDTFEGNQLSSEEGEGCSLGSPAGSQQAFGPNYFVCPGTIFLSLACAKHTFVTHPLHNLGVSTSVLKGKKLMLKGTVFLTRDVI